MFCPTDLPSLREIRQLTRDLPGVEPTAIFTVMRTLQVADALADAVEFYLQSRFGISAGRFSVLMILHRHPEIEMTPSELAERATVTRATVTGLLDGLEKDGLVARRAHSGDRRRVAIGLTAAGEEFIAKMIPEQAPRLSAVAGALSQSERRQLLRLLDKIQQGLHILGAPAEDEAFA